MCISKCNACNVEVVLPKVAYKGLQSSAVFKQPLADKATDKASDKGKGKDEGHVSSLEFLEQLRQSAKETVGYTEADERDSGRDSKIDNKVDSKGMEKKLVQEVENMGAPTGPVQPQYKLVERGTIDYADFVQGSRSGPGSGRPGHLVVTVSLPLVRAATDVVVDVRERELRLSVGETYRLDVS